MRKHGWLFGILLLLIPGTSVAQTAPSAPPGLKPHGQSTRLAVLLHAYTMNGSSMLLVENALLKADGWADTDVLAPDLPFELFSITPPAHVVADLLSKVDQAWEARRATGRPYASIALVGHSIGSLYARKLYVAGCGEQPGAPFEPDLKQRLQEIGAQPLDKPRPWAGAVDRIVLLAGLNRGWSISHHMSPLRASEMSTGVFLGRMLKALTGHQFIIMAAHRGAPFITQLRLQWLEMRKYHDRRVGEKLGAAKVVQLLGTTDDLVPPTDNVDPVTGSDFVYLEVPWSGHKNVHEMDNSEAGIARANVLQAALTRNDFGDAALRVPGIERLERTIENRQVTDVVFVVHGIRDEGYWTEKIANRVLAKARSVPGRLFEVETSTYGYFPMLSFLRPGTRQEKVEWLMDQYTTARVRYPDAKFSFIGHSNGTYLLAKALEDYPAVRFKHVVFAGSVVRRNFAWSQYMPSRIERVMNIVASADWVVAWFPNALQKMRFQDVGSAGHDGFPETGLISALQQPPGYVVGGHSAALDETWWNAIAGFVIDGRFEVPPGAKISGEREAWVAMPGEFAPLIWAAIALVLCIGLWALLRLRIREWQKTLFVVGYLTFIWVVLTEL